MPEVRRENGSESLGHYAQCLSKMSLEEIKEEQDLYLRWGIEIVGRYWEIHAFQPLPIAVEFPFSVFAPHRGDILLTGSIDQIRKTDGEFWLLDLKTGLGPRTKD